VGGPEEGAPQVVEVEGVRLVCGGLQNAIQERDASGTVVFYLVGGSNMSFTNEFTRENVQPMQMLAGGTMMVQYSFIGYPVQVDYVSR